MTNKLDELITLNEERTQGEWKSPTYHPELLFVEVNEDPVHLATMHAKNSNDAAFIAALANAAPALLRIADLASRLEEFGRDTPKELMKALEELK